MPASTFHEWVSTRAYASVRALLVTWLAVPVYSIAYAQTAIPSPTSTAATIAMSDAETRFAKGMALMSANDTVGAINVFTRLTQDYPRLPEPHVQLAALYVKQGEHRKALTTLRAALALRADDARVQAALGDVYVALAARAYRSAAAAGAPTNVQQKSNALEELERRTRAETAASP